MNEQFLKLIQVLRDGLLSASIILAISSHFGFIASDQAKPYKDGIDIARKVLISIESCLKSPTNRRKPQKRKK
jgi:hypothetical protein